MALSAALVGLPLCLTALVLWFCFFFFTREQSGLNHANTGTPTGELVVNRKSGDSLLPYRVAGLSSWRGQAVSTHHKVLPTNAG
jgi:hypothetical protein